MINFKNPDLQDPATGRFFLFIIVLLCMLAGAIGTAKAQNYELADSVGLVQIDSLYKLYFNWKNDDGTIADIKYSEPLDSATAANFAFNVAIGAGSILVQAAQLKMEKDRVDGLQNDAGIILSTLTGKNFRQTSEQRFISTLAINCDSTGTTCESFYTLSRRNETNKILRIRQNGSVREVNSNGSNTQGGLQGSVRFVAGSNQFEIAFTAGALSGTTLTFTTIPARRDRPRWSTDDPRATRYTLLQRKRLSDSTTANVLKR